MWSDLTDTGIPSPESLTDGYTLVFWILFGVRKCVISRGSIFYCWTVLKVKKIFSHVETISVFLASIWWSKMFIKYSTVERNSIAVLWHGMTKEVAIQYLQSLRWKFLGAVEITDGFRGPLPAGSSWTNQDTRLNTYCASWGNDAPGRNFLHTVMSLLHPNKQNNYGGVETETDSSWAVFFHDSCFSRFSITNIIFSWSPS